MIDGVSAVLNRVLHSITYNKKKNFIKILSFSVLFYLIIVMGASSFSSKEQVKELKNSIANAVTIFKTPLGELQAYDNFTKDEIEKITNDSAINKINITSIDTADFVNIEPVMEEGTKEYWESYQLPLPEGCTLFGITNSESCVMFAGAGLVLTKGTDITQKEDGKKVALISEELARKNSLALGSKITVCLPETNWKTLKEVYGEDFDEYFSVQTLELTVRGIFKFPDWQEKSTVPYEYQGNFVFVPQGTLTAYGKEQGTSFYMPKQVSVYLKDLSQVEEYITRIKERLGKQTLTQHGETVEYIYKWDKDWIDIVARPMNEIGRMTQVVTIIISVSTYIIMLLVSAFVLKGRKREFGILMSMGESKKKIIAQVILEELFLIFAALCLALLLGSATKNYVGSIMVGQSAKQTNTQLEQKQELFKLEGEQEGLFLKNILEHKSDLVKAKEQLAVSFYTKNMMIFMGLGIIFVLISLILQMLFFLKQSPIKLLLSKW